MIPYRNDLPYNNVNLPLSVDLNWKPPIYDTLTVCLKDKNISNLSPFLSDPFFCSSEENFGHFFKGEQKSMGVLYRLWKAFQITVGMGSIDKGSAKEQWHAHGERLAIPTEANIQASLSEINRRLIKLQQQVSSLKSNELSSRKHSLEKISTSLGLLWERQWAFMTHCGFSEVISDEQNWCHQTSEALLFDAKNLEKQLREETGEQLLLSLKDSQFFQFKEFFEVSNAKVAPELLLAANAQLLKNSYEVQPLSRLEMLSQTLALFDEASAVPSIKKLKKSLACAKEVQEKVVIPFRNYHHGLDARKYIGAEGMKSQLQVAVKDFKTILSNHLNELEVKGISTEKSSLLIPGGLSGFNGGLANLIPHLNRAIVRWMKENQLNLPDVSSILGKVENWIFTSSKIAYYEIVPDGNGTYTFRIYYGRPNAAHPEKVDYKGNSKFQSVASMSGITREALLSDAVLHTLIETQLIGDLVREVGRYTTDFLPPKEEEEKVVDKVRSSNPPKPMLEVFAQEAIQIKKQIVKVFSNHIQSASTAVVTNVKTLSTSLLDTLVSMVGARQANWDETRFEESLFAVLGGKEDVSGSSDDIPVVFSGSPEWDALLAVVKQSGSLEESERLIASLRLAILYHFCKNTDPVTLGNNEQMLSILSSAQQSVARWALSMESQHSFRKEDLQVVRLIISQASQLIAQSRELESFRLKKEAASVALTVRGYEQPFGSTHLPSVDLQGAVKIKTVDSTYRPIDQIVDWQLSEKTWIQDLQDFSKRVLTEIDEGNLLAVIDSVEVMAERSEDLLSFIDKIPSEVVESTITAISDIAHAYFVAHFDTRVPLHPDSKGFATAMVLMELGEELRQRLPEEYGLSKATLYGKIFKDYLSPNYFSFRSSAPPFAFRLYDPIWDKCLQRIEEKNFKYLDSMNFFSMGLKDEFTWTTLFGGEQAEHFGAPGDMGFGLWRYHSWFWPLAFEAARVDYQIFTTQESLSDHPFFQPLFKDNLPYRKAFEERFPDIAKEGDRMAQVAAAYGDPTESSLPKPFYDLRKLGIIARYFLRSPFAAVEGPVRDRQSYVNEFHGIYTPEISIPVPQFLIDEGWTTSPKITLVNKKVRFFSEVEGVNKDFLNEHSDIAACSDDFDDCHRFTHTFDRFQNEVLNEISNLLGGKNQSQTLMSNMFTSLDKWRKEGSKGSLTVTYSDEDRDSLNINTAMTKNLNQDYPGGLDWKDYVRLVSLFSQKRTQIASVISFFSNRLNLFEDNEKKEWRSLLQHALFEPGLMLDALSDTSQRTDIIQSLDFFCDKAYRYFHSLQKNDEAAYFLDLSLMIARYIENIHLENGKGHENLKILDRSSLIEKLRSAIAVKGTLTERHKGPLAGVLARHLLAEYKVYSHEELAEILEAVMLYYRYPSQVDSESRQRREAIIKGMRRIAPQIKRLMTDETRREALLKTLIERVEPSASGIQVSATDGEGLRYASKDEELRIDLLEGRILKSGMGDQTLPAEVLKDPSYRVVFGDQAYWVSLLSPSSWEFVNQNGHLCRVIKEREGCQIQIQLKAGRWYRYVPPDAFIQTSASIVNRQVTALRGLEDRTSSLGSLQFTEGYTHWYHEGPPSELLLLDAKTHQECYRVTLTHARTLSSLGGKDTVHSIYDLSQNPPLKLANIYQEEHRYSWLENIEDLRHVMLWNDAETGMLTRIELPRYRRFRDIEQADEDSEGSGQNEGLSFTIRNNKAYCDQIPEYYLESRQYSDQLPHLKSLLVLRNVEGNQKIILPYWRPQVQAGLALRPHFRDPRSKGITQHDYIVLEKAKDKAVFTGADLQANLYQALMLQTQHRYAEATEVLVRSGHSPKVYTYAQRKVFDSIIHFAMNLNRDEQPDAFVPAMQAIFLLIKDHMAHGTDMSTIDPYIKSVFMEYGKNLSNMDYLGQQHEIAALLARYLLEKENQLGGDIKQQYLKLSEVNPTAAHRALAEYAHKLFSQKGDLLNQGLHLFEKFNPSEKSDQPSPYAKITAVSESALIQLFKKALSSKSSYLVTGLMLQPTEEEFAIEFLSLLEKMRKGSAEERKSIADRCRLMQSKHQAVIALSQILIEFEQHPESFLNVLPSISIDRHLKESDLENLIPVLIKAASQKASKDKKVTPINEKDLWNFANEAINLLDSFFPQFDSQKDAPSSGILPSMNVSKSMPEHANFGFIIDGWNTLFVQNQTEVDVQSDSGMQKYTKILSPYTSDDISSRFKEESKLLIDSIGEYLKRSQGSWSFKDETARTQVIQQKELLRNKIIVDERDLASKELEILAFFNRIAKDKGVAVKEELKQIAGEIKSRALPELILLFARGELNLLATEKGLSNQELKIGIRLISNYLTVAKRRDTLKYGLLPLVDKLAALKPMEYEKHKEQEILEDLTAVLKAKPIGDPEEQPAVSGFEYFNRLLVREEQWGKIQELQEFFEESIKNDEAPRHLVQKLEMGFGKTFLVMPIYGFCAANGERLSMALLPKELIEDMSKEISGILGNTFGQKLQRLDFERNTEFTVQRLEDIVTTLTDTKKNRHFLMMTSQSVRSFYLKFVETWAEYEKVLELTPSNPYLIEEYEQKIELMRQVLALWEDADVIFDEEDLILNSKQRLSFAIGKSKKLPEERVSLVVELYKILTSEAFNNEVNLSLEFFNNSDKDVKKNPYAQKKNPFTLKYYHEKVKPIIARMVLEKLSQKVQDANEISSFARNFPDLSNIIKRWSPKELALVSAFILDKDADGKGSAFLKKQREDLRQVFGLLKGELNELLLLTLNRNYAERYGFHHQKDALAGPFSGSNTPNKGSQFTDAWEIVNYTEQAHFKRGNYKLLISQILANAREQAKKERMVRGCGLDETQSFIHFERMIGKRTGVNLFQENALEKICDLIIEDVDLQSYMIENFILPEIRTFPIELSATSQAFSLIFNVTKGFTGTPWNWQTFPKGTLVSAIADTDGATLIPLYKKSANRVFEVSYANENNKRAASLFDNNPSFKGAQAFIDSGGILKGIPHEEIARQLFTLPWFRDSFDGVLFFDEKGNKKVLEKEGKIAVSFENSSIPMNRRFTFYDQKHSTGTNIKQLHNAKGVISVSKQMILRELMQGAKRFRLLHKGQQLDIVIYNEDAQVIKETLNVPKEQKLDFDHVIFSLWKQQLERMGEENFSAAPHKMEAKLQKPIFELMKDSSKKPKDIVKVFSKSKSLFFKEINDNPFARYGEPRVFKSKKEVMDLKIKELLNPEITSLFLNDKHLQHLDLFSQEALQDWVLSSVNMDHLDDKLLVSSGMNDHETEMELEEEQEEEQESEVENQIEQQMEEELRTEKDRKPIAHIPEVVGDILSRNDWIHQVKNKVFGKKTECFSLYAWTGRNREDPSHEFSQKNIYDLSIHVSQNQFNSYRYSHLDNGKRQFKPVEYVLIHSKRQWSDTSYEVFLIDANDAADANKELKYLNNPFSNDGWSLYALGVGQVQHAGTGIEGKPGHEEPALLSLLVQVKFADGEIYYNEDEQTVLKDWIERVGVEKVESEIKYILRDQPARRDAYATSSLGNLIQSIKEKAKP